MEVLSCGRVACVADALRPGPAAVGTRFRRKTGVRAPTGGSTRSALTAAALARLGHARLWRPSTSSTRLRAATEDERRVPDNPEKVFREAFDVEVQQIVLLLERLEALRPDLPDRGVNQDFAMKLKAVKQLSPNQAGGKPSWREAFEAAKQVTVSLEELLEEARTMPPLSADFEDFPSTGQGNDGASTDSTTTPVQVQEPEEVKNLEGVSEKIIEDESVLRFIAMPVLGLGQSGDGASLPSVEKVRRALGADCFIVQSQVLFDRVYIFTGQVASDATPSAALAAMRKRLAALSSSAELFLQPTMNSGQSALLVMLRDDMPSGDFLWWQWILCGFALVASVVSVNFEAFTVSPLTSEQFAVVSINELPALARQTAPSAACILAVVAAMEAARRVAAAKYGVVLTPPFLVPVWPIPSIGCFGAISRRLSIVPSEEANLAMSVSAGLTGYLASLVLIVVGIVAGPDQEQSISLNYEPLPLVLKLLLRPMLGEPSDSRQSDPFSDPVAIAFPANPVMIGGVIGLVLTSLNLLSLGRLDGAILARSSLRSLRLLPGLLSFGILCAGCLSTSGASYLYGLFAIYALVLQSGYNRPVRDGVSEPETSLSLTAIALVVTGILLSLPGSFPGLQTL
ncbi:EGY3 [Symbiodinium sp. CCMP2592]|nr:EGY3 [Symbiodinium sp. CCMP2592]